MVDWGFLAFSVVFGIFMIPFGLFYLENGIYDSKFISGPTAFLNSYMPYFAYLVSAFFIGGYCAITIFMYKEDYRHEIRIRKEDSHD